MPSATLRLCVNAVLSESPQTLCSCCFIGVAANSMYLLFYRSRRKLTELLVAEAQRRSGPREYSTYVARLRLIIFVVGTVPVAVSPCVTTSYAQLSIQTFLLVCDGIALVVGGPRVGFVLMFFMSFFPEADMDEQPRSKPKRWHWVSLWVVSEIITVVALIAWYEWPRWQRNERANERATNSAIVAPSAVNANAAPVTRDSSVRTADNVPMGTQAGFDTLMRDVTTVENSIAVDMRYRGSNNFTSAPLPGYEANRAYLRREAAAALGRVQAALKREGLGLLVYDAYRPVRATDAMVAWTQRTGQESLVRDGYISDRSRHNLGVAIDLTLVQLSTGQPLDMGVAFDTFSSASHTANATGKVAANRQRFVAAMAREGFTNYDQEWWHFTYDVPAESLRRFDIVIH